MNSTGVRTGRLALLRHRVVRALRLAVAMMAQPIDAVRTFRNEDYRRCPTMQRTVPVRRMRAVLVLVVVSVLATAVLAFAVRPARTGLLITLLIAALVVIGYRVWNGPVGLRARGLPPGRRSILFWSLLESNHFRRGWQRFGPIFTSNSMYKPVVAIGGLELGSTVLRDHAAEMCPAVFPHSRGVVGGPVRNQHGERHRRSRSVFVKAFAPAVVNAARPAIEAIVIRHLDSWAAEPPAPAPARTLRARNDDLSLDVLLALLLGLTCENHPLVHARVTEIFERNRLLVDPVAAESDTAALTATVAELAQRPDGLVPSALRTMAERNPEALLDPVIPSNLVHLLRTARHDVAGMLSWLAYFLGHHPAWLLRVREAGADDAAASWVVSETLRLAQSEFVVREVVTPVRLDGFTIPKGWWVRVLVRESHRDPRVFDDPDRFDPQRFALGPLPRSAYSPFGLDDHSCVGEAVTRTTAKVFVRELAASYVVQVPSDGRVVFDEHHHWAPAPEMAARLVRLSQNADDGDDDGGGDDGGGDDQPNTL